MTEVLSYFVITLRVADLENVYVIDVLTVGESFFKPLLLMTSILCAIVRVCRNKFKWNYLKTFYIILLNFLN